MIGPVFKAKDGVPLPPGAAAASLIAARNEFESFQIFISAGSSQRTGVRASLDGGHLAGTATTSAPIPNQNVTIYREMFDSAGLASDQEGSAGKWASGLLPTVDPIFGEARSAFPTTIDANTFLGIWVDILVPQTAAPDTYTGAISVTGDDFTTIRVPITLRVFNATLPSTSSLRNVFGIGWSDACLAHFGNDCSSDEEKGWRTNALYALAALNNRITLGPAQYQPLTAGNKTFFEQNLLPLINGTDLRERLPGAKMTSFQADTNATALPMWRDEARSQNFQDRSFIYVCDEPLANATKWAACQNTATTAQNTWPEAKRLVTATQSDASQAGQLSWINILVPLVNFMDDKPGRPFAGNQRSTYNTFLQTAGNQVWMYTSCMSHGCAPSGVNATQCKNGPEGGETATNDAYFDGWLSYVTDAPASEGRAMGWLAYVYNTSGELYFQVSHCLAKPPDQQYAYGGNGDGTLFYAGKPTQHGGSTDFPIESIRLKLIRDGYEDYEYLKLADGINATQTRNIATALFPTTHDTNRTDQQVQQVRRQLAKIIDPSVP
ncbi:MAG TPA: DUF4091 domain-containing protein [Gemmatimonadaceae bacterium]